MCRRFRVPSRPCATSRRRHHYCAPRKLSEIGRKKSIRKVYLRYQQIRHMRKRVSLHGRGQELSARNINRHVKSICNSFFPSSRLGDMKTRYQLAYKSVIGTHERKIYARSMTFFWIRNRSSEVNLLQILITLITRINLILVLYKSHMFASLFIRLVNFLVLLMI